MRVIASAGHPARRARGRPPPPALRLARGCRPAAGRGGGVQPVGVGKLVEQRLQPASRSGVPARIGGGTWPSVTAPMRRLACAASPGVVDDEGIDHRHRPGQRLGPAVSDSATDLPGSHSSVPCAPTWTSASARRAATGRRRHRHGAGCATGRGSHRRAARACRARAAAPPSAWPSAARRKEKAPPAIRVVLRRAPGAVDHRARPAAAPPAPPCNPPAASFPAAQSADSSAAGPPRRSRPPQILQDRLAEASASSPTAWAMFQSRPG